MDELNKEYTILFNGITDTIQQMEMLTRRLKKLQMRAEEAYLQECEAEDVPPTALEQPAGGEEEES